MLIVGDSSRLVLHAVAAGRVQRAPLVLSADGPRRPHFGPPRYLLDGVEAVDGQLAALLRDDLVFLPKVGPPRLTPDGEWALTNFT